MCTIYHGLSGFDLGLPFFFQSFPVKSMPLSGSAAFISLCQSLRLSAYTNVSICSMGLVEHLLKVQSFSCWEDIRPSRFTLAFRPGHDLLSRPTYQDSLLTRRILQPHRHTYDDLSTATTQLLTSALWLLLT